MYFIDIMPLGVRSGVQRKIYRPSETILFAEEENKYVYFLVEGIAEASIQSADGGFATLHLYREGSFFGEIEQFYEGRKPVEIIAMTECVIDRLYKDDFLAWLEDDFEAVKFLIKELAGKLIRNAELVEDVLALTVKDRLLRSIAVHYHRNTISTLTKHQLAKEINTPVRSLNRAIAECEKQQILSFSNNTFVILNPKEMMKALPYIESTM